MGTNLQALYSSSAAENTKTEIICKKEKNSIRAGWYVNQAGRKGVRAGRKTVRAGRKTVRAGRKGVRTGRKGVRAGRKTVRAGRKGVRTGRKGVRTGRKGVRAGRKTVRAGRSALRNMPSWNTGLCWVTVHLFIVRSNVVTTTRLPC